MTHQYFAFDPNDNSMQTFETEAEAIKYASEAIPLHLDDHWSEEVEQIVVGRITHHTVKVGVVDRPADADLDEYGYDKDGRCWHPEIAEICDYQLQPI